MSDITFPDTGELTPGYEWTNPATGVEYTWNGERWIIVDTSEGIDLQGVLTNGNIADKSIALTNGSDDAVLLSPEDARIMIGGVGSNVVPRFELRHKTGLLDTSIVKLELDEDGERFDIECDEKVDNIHFRFENDVKFELNKSGDAKFSGGAEFKDRVTIDRSPLGESNSFIVKGGIRNSNNDVVIGSMFRAYHDAADLTKDSGMEYKGKIYNSNNLVNKGYVDTADEAHETAIKAYVDTKIAGISGGTEGLFEASYWTLDASMDRDEVTNGKFHFDGSDFYMARSTAGGHTWCPGAQGWRTTNAWVTIYSKAGKLMHTFEIARINFKEKYGKKYIVEFEDTWSYKTSDLVNGEEYIIVIPGFMT